MSKAMANSTGSTVTWLFHHQAQGTGDEASPWHEAHGSRALRQPDGLPDARGAAISRDTETVPERAT